MFKTNFRVLAGLGVLGTSVVTRDKQKLAWIDYDVKKGLRWTIKFYTEEEKQNAFLEITEKKFALSGEGGYDITDLKTGKSVGTWVPKKRFLNFFLAAGYKLFIDDKVVLTSPAEGFGRLFLPKVIRNMMGRKIYDADGNLVAKVKWAWTFAEATLEVLYTKDGKMEDDVLATAFAAMAAITIAQY